MGNRWSPGCSCCGCTFTSETICVCNCMTAFSRSASVGDDLGTHTLTWVSGTPMTWAGQVTIPDEPYYRANLDGTCALQGTIDQPIFYRLSPICETSQWRLRIMWWINLCSDTVGGRQHHTFGVVGGGVGSLYELDTFIDMDCEELDALTFDVPTTSFPTGGAIDGMPTPGGGGSLTVVFS